MIKRNRKKQVIVQDMLVLNVTFSSILQVGDVHSTVYPFIYSEGYAGYRGAPSFVTQEVQEPVNTRLHYANQIDEDNRDFDIIGEKIETFPPNTRGVEAR